MKESEFNRTIKHSLEQRGGFAYKISDASGGFGQKRPFDGLGALPGKPIYWEGKMSKGLKAFNIKTVFEGERGHQMTTMALLDSLIGDIVELWVPYLCYEPRDSKVYLFSYRGLSFLHRKGVKSIKASHLKKLQHNVLKGSGSDRIILGDLISLKENDLEFILEGDI